LTDVEKLLVVQSHDLKIRELEKALKYIPVLKQEEKKRLTDHQNALADAENSLKSLQSKLKQMELETESMKEKIGKLRGQQVEVKKNEEFRALEREITTINGGISAIEDGELGLMQDLDSLRAVVAEKQGNLKEEESKLAADEKVMDERGAVMQKELDLEKQCRANAAKDVPAQCLHAYERIFARKDRAVVPIEDGNCSGCHLKVTPTVLHAARAKTSIVACNFCGRLVY
jgi:uncharacterized protein